MQFINNALFKISKLERHDGVLKAVLAINKDCLIFKGHFPGQPVLPGACMLQIVKEVLEKALGACLRLKKAEYLKFMLVIGPESTSSVNLDIVHKELAESQIKITARLTNAELVYFKFQGTFLAL